MHLEVANYLVIDCLRETVEVWIKSKEGNQKQKKHQAGWYNKTKRKSNIFDTNLATQSPTH